MILKKIHIKNFFLIEESEVELGQGLFHLVGLNHDDLDSNSNGSGKSSFCEAILWGLTGQTIRKSLAKNDVIGPFDKYCEVIVELEKDGQAIRIERFRNKPTERNNDPKVFLDGVDVSQHKNTDEKICQILGFNHQMLMLSGYSSSREDNFCKLTPSKKINVLKDALDIRIYDQYDAWLKSQISSLEGEMEKAELTESHINRSRRMLFDSYEMLEKRQALEQEKIDREIEEMQQAILDNSEQAKKVADLISKKEDAIAKKNELNYSISNFSGIANDRKEYQSKLDELGRLYEKNKRIYSETATELKTVESKLDNIVANPLSECQYCGSHIEQGLDTAQLAARFTSERDQLKARVIILKDKLDASESKYKAHKSRSSEIEEKFAVLQADLDQRTKIDLWLESLETKQKNLVVHLNRVEESKRRIDRLSLIDLSKDFEEEKTSLLSKIETYNKELEENSSIISRQVQAKADMEDLRKIIKQIKSDSLDMFIDNLSNSINYYLDKICGSIECQTILEKDNLELKFSRSGSDWSHFSLFSDGESTKISKSVSLAMNDVFNVGFMIDDEGLGGLDNQGAQLILEYLSGEDFMGTMIFVSHDSAIKDYLNEHNQIQVEKKDNKITVKVLKNVN